MLTNIRYIRNTTYLIKIIIGIALVLVLLLLHTNITFAAFSSFEVITPDNEAEYPFLIQVQPLENQPGYTRVRVIGPIDDDKRAWLIECKQSLFPESQNFRMTIWGYKQFNDDVIKITPLKPGQTTVPGKGNQAYPYVEVVLSNKVMQRSYLYIDFPREVKDGGYYYSIDLAYYLEGALGKKRQIQWEK